MDANHNNPEDELSRLERRLAGWRPAEAAPGADAMLFAAGRASARGARVLWQAVAGVMTVLSVALAVWLAVERSERQQLLLQLQTPPAVPPIPSNPSTDEESQPNSYLAVRQLILERGVDAWTDSARSMGDPAVPSPEPSVLQLWPRDRLLELQ